MTATPLATTPRPGKLSRLRRVGLSTLALLTVAFTVLAQLLAIVPVSWTMPLLQWQPLQYSVILLGVLRDSLGAWNVLVAVIGVVCAALLWRPRSGHWRLASWLTAAGTVGTVASILTTVMLIASLAPLGVGRAQLLPTVPFTGFGGAPTRTITAGTAGTTTLRADLYLPSGTSPRAGWPVVVSIHGGGFSTGTKGPNAYTGFLPEHGYAVLDVDYRLASPTYHPWRTQVEDIGCSLAWLGSTGRAHHLDPDRIATLGLSSGGNLAINAAYMTANHTLRSSCSPKQTDLPTVRAVIGGYPAVDLTGIGNQTAVARQVEQWYVGGTPATYPNRYRFTDSASHISDASPPTLIYQGTRDHLVLADRTRDFADLLSQRGVTDRYVEYPGLEHGAGDASATSTYSATASRQVALNWLRQYDHHFR